LHCGTRAGRCHGLATGGPFASTGRGRRTVLFFTNDHGVHIIDPAAGAAGTVREVATPDQREKVLALYRDHRKTLRRERLAIPRRVPPMCGHNLWASNAPGSTLFMTVCDVSHALIGLIAQFVDARLERFGMPCGMNIVDDRYGFRPAGTEQWLKLGFLDERNVLPLSHLERQATYFMFSEPAMICQNIFLDCEAIGLGGWMHCGFLSREIFEALGCTMVAPAASPLLVNPVGFDGVFHAFCPPFYPSMDAAVDAVLTPLLREGPEAGGMRARPVAYRMPDSEHRSATVELTAEGIACTKAVCNYIYDTYGRFPGGVDALHLMWLMQVHHIDTAFYDHFFEPGAYGPTHAAHMADWHGERSAPRLSPR
jgi:hypothetical protein